MRQAQLQRHARERHLAMQQAAKQLQEQSAVAARTIWGPGAVPRDDELALEQAVSELVGLRREVREHVGTCSCHDVHKCGPLLS